MIVLAAAAMSLAALPPADRDDIRCLAYLTVAAGKVDGDLQRKVEGGALYYFGRLEARSPTLDVAAALDSAIHDPAYDRQAYEADKARCHVQLDPLATRFDAWRETYEKTR